MTNAFNKSSAMRALGHFAIGKVASAATSGALLVVLARSLSIGDFALYVALLALLEISLLWTSLGAYTIPHRYLTEARAAGNGVELRTTFWWSLLYRSITLAIGAVALWACGPELISAIGMSDPARVAELYGLVILFEGTARYFDLAYEALLKQGVAQANALFRNAVRLCGAVICANRPGDIELLEFVTFEVLASALSVAAASVYSVSYFNRIASAASMGRGRVLTASRLLRFSIPFYLAQCLSQLYSPDGAKLVISRVFGAAEVAAFGFAHSLSAMLFRFLPINVLLGWIRPLLVSKHTTGSSQAFDLLGLALKFNYILLTPIVACVAANASGIVNVLAGEKLHSSGVLLAWLVTLLLVQSLHLALSLLVTLVEEQRAALVGSMAAVVGMVIGSGLALVVDRSVGVICGLWFSEVVYCLVVAFALRRKGYSLGLDTFRYARLVVAAGAAAWSAKLLIGDTRTLETLGLHVALTGVLYLVALLGVRPFNKGERALIQALLPSATPRFVKALV